MNTLSRNLVNVSEAEILDCSTDIFDHGCHGGVPIVRSGDLLLQFSPSIELSLFAGWHGLGEGSRWHRQL